MAEKKSIKNETKKAMAPVPRQVSQKSDEPQQEAVQEPVEPQSTKPMPLLPRLEEQKPHRVLEVFRTLHGGQLKHYYPGNVITDPGEIAHLKEHGAKLTDREDVLEIKCPNCDHKILV